MSARSHTPDTVHRTIPDAPAFSAATGINNDELLSNATPDVANFTRNTSRPDDKSTTVTSPKPNPSAAGNNATYRPSGENAAGTRSSHEDHTTESSTTRRTCEHRTGI